MALYTPQNKLPIGLGAGRSGFAWSNVGVDPLTDQLQLAKVLADATTTARKLETRFAEKINALDMGMVNDGAMTSNTIGGIMTGTDNTAAFQAALDYVGLNGKVLYIPPGMYRFADPGAAGHSVLLNYNTYLLEGSPGYTTFLIDDNGLANTNGAELIDTAGSSTDPNLRALFYIYGITFQGRFSQINEGTWNGLMGRNVLQTNNFSRAQVDSCQAFDIRGTFNAGEYGSTASIVNSYFNRVARGSINRFLDWDCLIEMGNTIENQDDNVDSPVNFSTTYIRSQIVCANNNYRQSVGALYFGAKNTLIIGNNIKLPFGAGISVGGTFSTNAGLNAITNLVIANNTIENGFARWSASTSSLNTVGATDYGNAGIAVYGVPMNQATTAGLPGYTSGSGIVDPLGQDSANGWLSYNFFDSASSPDKSVPQSYGIAIVGNKVVNTQKSVPLPTGKFQDYGWGPMFTKQGFQNPTIAQNNLLLNGITLGSDMRGAIIADNEVVGYRSGTGIFFNGTDSGDNNRAFADCLVVNNRITDVFTGIATSNRGTGTNTARWGIKCLGNYVNVDPNLVQAARSVSKDGSWQAAIAATSQPVGICLDGVTGWHLAGNTIKNAYDPVQPRVNVDNEAICIDNVLECNPAALGFSTSNTGLGYVHAGGPRFRYVIINSSGLSANYDLLINHCAVQVDACPIVGKWVTGTFVANTGKVVTDVLGWLRVTLGTGNVYGVDWTPVYNAPGVSTYGADATLALTDANCTVEMQKGSGTITLTVPADATTMFPIGTRIPVVKTGTATVAFAAASGVTLDNSALTLTGTDTHAWLYKRSANRWCVTASV